MSLSASIRDGGWLTRNRAVSVLTLMGFGYVGCWAYLLGGPGRLDPLGRAVGTDFAAFYAASMALRVNQGEALYSLSSYAEIVAPWTGGRVYPFYYPPSALLLFFPLSFAPYGLALATAMVVGTILFLGAVWRTVPRPLALPAGLLFPAVFMATIHGHSSLLLAAAFGAALLLLDRSPFCAGLLMGFVASVKPHLVGLVPVALVGARNWRALFGSATGLAGAIIASGCLFGWQLWSAFASSTEVGRAVLEQGAIPYSSYQSMFAAVRLAGGDVPLAYGIQATVAAAAVAAVWHVWRRGGALEYRAAVLVGCGLLATPYAFDYDLTFLGIALAFVVRGALRDGWVPWERTLAAAAWLLPFVARPVARTTHLVMAPVLLGALVLLMYRRTRSSGRPASSENRTIASI